MPLVFTRLMPVKFSSVPSTGSTVLLLIRDIFFAYSIKPFAKWRKKISKSLTKKNIEHRLILLSILQTCKYQGLNFFEFLKSGKKSIYDYSEN
jgi:hypothetical protein